MFKIFTVLGASLALASCNSNQGYDGYIFGHKQYEKTSVIVNVVTYKSDLEFKQAAKKYVHDSDYTKVAAFTLSSNDSDICTIHMMDPSVKYQPEFIGHEFAHCLYGQWHTDNNSRS